VRHLPLLRRTVHGIDPAVRRAMRAVIQGESPWPLFIHGPAGLGKTCAALCMLDHAGGEYLTVQDLGDLLIQAQQGRLFREIAPGQAHCQYPEDFWQRLGRQPLVVLDEIGTREKVSDHHYECVKRLLDRRHGLPLLCCSNLDLARLEKVYDDRVASRLAAGTVACVKGADRRLAR
jgi:DNA replication protein DnaC